MQLVLILVHVPVAGVIGTHSGAEAIGRPPRGHPRDLPQVHGYVLSARGPGAPPGDRYALRKLQMAADKH